MPYIWRLSLLRGWPQYLGKKMSSKALRDAMKELVRAARVELNCISGKIRDPEFQEFAREQIMYAIRTHHRLKAEDDAKPPE